MQWLRRTFITGFFVMVPLVISVVAIYWVVDLANRLTVGFGGRLSTLIGFSIPGLGIITTALLVLAVGAIANNVIGRRIFQRGESLLLHVPLFRAVYAPVKQLIQAFSPDNEMGFKRMVLIAQSDGTSLLGFLTREFTVDLGNGLEPRYAVYVPTNHLYLGDILICTPDRATFPDMPVEAGIRFFLTGGMAVPPRIRIDRTHP